MWRGAGGIRIALDSGWALHRGPFRRYTELRAGRNRSSMMRTLLSDYWARSLFARYDQGVRRGPLIAFCALLFLSWILVPMFVSEVAWSRGVGDIVLLFWAVAIL